MLKTNTSYRFEQLLTKKIKNHRKNWSIIRKVLLIIKGKASDGDQIWGTFGVKNNFCAK